MYLASLIDISKSRFCLLNKDKIGFLSILQKETDSNPKKNKETNKNKRIGCLLCAKVVH